MKGWKTYVAAAVMAIYGVVGYIFELHGMDTATTMVLNALVLAGLRNGITNDVDGAVKKLR